MREVGYACRRYGRVWLLLTMIPFHLAAAADDPEEVVTLLTRPYTLSGTPQPDDTRYFRITRLETTLNADGQVTGKTRSTGLFKQTVLYVNEDGSRVDRYTWKTFALGRAEGGADSIQQAEVRAVQGFSYDLSTADPHSLPPLEIGGTAKTLETFAFFTMVWDAATFMSAVTPHPAYPFHTVRRIGDRVRETRPRAPANFDFTPVVTRFAYTRRPLTAAFTGLSLVGRIPCAVVRFETAENPIAFDLNDHDMVIHLEGTESITGHICIGLDQHTVVRGEMHNLVVASQHAVMPGRRIHTPLVVRQQVTLESIPASVYEQDAGSDPWPDMTRPVEPENR